MRHRRRAERGAEGGREREREREAYVFVFVILNTYNRVRLNVSSVAFVVLFLLLRAGPVAHLPGRFNGKFYPVADPPGKVHR